jgi:uncharacterized protein YgiM (DUF1202 family)
MKIDNTVVSVMDFARVKRPLLKLERGKKKASIYKITVIILFLFVCNTSYADKYTTTSDLKFRKSASGKANTIGLVKNGETVEVIDKSNSEWFQVEYNGQMGYLASKYLVLIHENIKPTQTETPVIQEEHSLGGMWFGIIASILMLYFIIRNSIKKPKKQQKRLILKEEIKEQLNKDLMKSIDIIVTTSTDNEGIIDVTGKSQVITPSISNKVPYWSHQYVYSYNELNGATTEQRRFYNEYKIAFMSGQCLDIEGNTNYAFILLFDLLANHDQNLPALENWLNTLGANYPKTKSYAMSFLEKKMRKAGDDAGAERLKIDNSDFGSYENLSLGSRYKEKLKLNATQVTILNNLIDTSNKFNSIEHCAISLIDMFLHTINELEEIFKKEQGSIKEYADAIAVVEIAKHYRYRNGSYNYKSAYEVFINNIYQTIYKVGENKLRDHYNVGRKTELNWYIHSEQALLEFNLKFQPHLENLLDAKIRSLKPTDLETEIFLNEYNKARWKDKLEELEVATTEARVQDYIKSIYELEKTNQRNPSIENIFFQASKFISKYDKTAALIFYIDYIYYDLKSVKFDNKQLTKTIQKGLFKNEEQLRMFGAIVDDFVKDKNRSKAVEAVSQLYAVKRKKIQLDTSAIKEVNEKHSDTVQLLNEYLQDEETDTMTVEIGETETMVELQKEVVKTPVVNKYGLNINQLELLEIISKNSFLLTGHQVEVFAKSKGVFRNQLVESINEACYETIDDLLIEEDDENYIINENYYQKLFAA